ncbi:MAG: hypothetical protein AAFO58_13395, partial [Pseudomonadota bacterium]
MIIPRVEVVDIAQEIVERKKLVREAMGKPKQPEPVFDVPHRDPVDLHQRNHLIQYFEIIHILDKLAVLWIRGLPTRAFLPQIEHPES